MSTSHKFSQSLYLASVWPYTPVSSPSWELHTEAVGEERCHQHVFTSFHCEISSCLCDANKSNAVEILGQKTMFIIGATAAVPHRTEHLWGLTSKPSQGKVSWRDKPLSPHARFHLSNVQRLVGRGRAHENGDINWRELITPLLHCRILVLHCCCLQSK